MRLAIFGASGRTGRHLVEQALAAGHAVTVLVRDPARLEIQNPRLTVIQGDIQDVARVAEAVQGAEAVVSALGPTSNRPAFEVSRGMDHLLAAMRAHNVRRLIVSAGAGVRDPQDQPTLLHAFFGALVQVLTPNAYQDMLQVVEKVRASDREWTVVRVPRLSDDPRSGQLRVGVVGKDLGTRLGRADLADFMLRQLADRTYVRQAPAISH